MTEEPTPLFAAPLAPQSLGEALRLLRHRARVSRDQLAQRASVSSGAISNYENDVSAPPAAVLRRVCGELAALLGCPTSELWDQMGLMLDHVAEPTQKRPGAEDGAPS